MEHLRMKNDFAGLSKFRVNKNQSPNDFSFIFYYLEDMTQNKQLNVYFLDDISLKLSEICFCIVYLV